MKVSLGSIEVTDEERRAIADDLAHLEPVPKSGMATKAQIKAWATGQLGAMFEELVEGYREHRQAELARSSTPSAMVYDFNTRDRTTYREVGDDVAFHTELIGYPGQVAIEQGTITGFSPGGMSGLGTVTMKPRFRSGWSSERNIGQPFIELDITGVHWPPRRA